MEFIGDADGVLSLLKTLHVALGDDLPRLKTLLDQDDMHGVNRLLHQLKGFTPVFCVDSLVELVVSVEQLSKHADAQDVRTAYSSLAPQLEQLRGEVAEHLDQHTQN